MVLGKWLLAALRPLAVCVRSECGLSRTPRRNVPRSLCALVRRSLLCYVYRRCHVQRVSLGAQAIGSSCRLRRASIAYSTVVHDIQHPVTVSSTEQHGALRLTVPRVARLIYKNAFCHSVPAFSSALQWSCTYGLKRKDLNGTVGTRIRRRRSESGREPTRNPTMDPEIREISDPLGVHG